MAEFSIQGAIGNHIIIEPVEKSSVLKAEEISTVFKVVSIGNNSELVLNLCIGDLIIVAPGSVEKVKMGYKDVYYVGGTSVVSKVTQI